MCKFKCVMEVNGVYRTGCISKSVSLKFCNCDSMLYYININQGKRQKALRVLFKDIHEKVVVLISTNSLKDSDSQWKQLKKSTCTVILHHLFS